MHDAIYLSINEERREIKDQLLCLVITFTARIRAVEDCKGIFHIFREDAT